MNESANPPTPESPERASLDRVSLTGVKPTGEPHLGNYLGAIRPGIQLTEQYKAYYFIADYHAVTTERDPKALQDQMYTVTATWLASGLDPKHALIYRQSDVIEVFELAWTLSCLLAAGQLERGHAYKDAVAKGGAPNAGLLYYPVLMAADILLYDANIVPVGKDQTQHLELCRDVAQRVNHIYGDNTLVVPEIHLADVPVIPGTDGNKMAKSAGNGIPVFETEKRLRKAIMGIKTSSESMEEPKEAEGTVLFDIFRAVATPDQCADLKKRLAAGNFGWGHAKQELFEVLNAELAPKRELYNEIRADEDRMDEILADGAARARRVAKRTINRVRERIGISRPVRKEKKTLRIKK